MVDTITHKTLDEVNAHPIFMKYYANEAARLADVSLVTADIYKAFYQISDDSIWMLKSVSPNVWVQITTPGAPAVGSMYIYDSTIAIVINVVDEYHGVKGFSVGAANNGFTFLASATGSITNTADNGSGKLRCTDVAHGLLTGQYITLTGMGDTAHNRVTRVTKIDADTFDCDDISFNSGADTGTWDRGSSLTVNTDQAGTYHVSFSCSVSSAGNNKNYKFECYKNTTPLDEFAAERMIAVLNDLGNLASSGTVALVAGDVLWLAVANTTDATNLTVKHASLNALRH